MNADNKCPSPECHEDRILVAEDVKYLKKSYEELKNCCGYFVKKPHITVIVFFAGLLVSFAITEIKVWSETDKSEYKFAKTESVEAVKQDVAVLKTEKIELQKDIEEIKKTQQDQSKDIKDILKILREEQ